MASAAKAVGVLASLLLALGGSAGPAEAGNRWVTGSESESLGPLRMDPLRPRGYALDAATDELVVFDSAREEVLARIPLGSPGHDLAIDRTATWLVVALDDGFGRLRLPTLEYSELPVPAELTGRPISVAFHASGALFAAANRNPPGWSPSVAVFVLSPDLSEVLGSFRRLTSPHDYYFPLVRTDREGRVLYLLERGLSPATLYVLDVEDPVAPRLLDSTAHPVRIGENCRDLAPAPAGEEVYLACGAPYGLQVVPVPDLEPPVLLSTGPYPAAVAVGPLGESLLLATSSPYNDFLYQFSATTGELIGRYELADEVDFSNSSSRGLGVGRDGNEAFVVHGRPPVEEAVQAVDIARAILAFAAPPRHRIPRRQRQWITVVVPSLDRASGDPVDLDATLFRRRFVTFGPAGAPALRRVGWTWDVDRDGDRDLVLLFAARAAGLDCTSSTARLTFWKAGEVEAFAFVDVTGAVCP